MSMQMHGHPGANVAARSPYSGFVRKRPDWLDEGVDADLAARLRADLLATRYTVDRLLQLWGDDADAALARGDRVPARRALRVSSDPAARLARLLLLGEAAGAAGDAGVDSADSTVDAALDAALPTLGAAGARALGLIDAESRAALDLRPSAAIDAAGPVDWLIASDLGETALGGPLPPEHVLGVGGASITLSGLIPTSPVGSVLDLGTGCGIQALHAARHATRVVATDLSARALELAALTLALNGVTSVELRRGDLYAPVAGERFDRIISNPPFVITPRVEGVPVYEYRDGGRVGDALVEEVIRGAAAHLVPGGTAHLLANWEYRDAMAGDGLARVRRWADEAGLEAWVVERERQTPAQYAATWIRDGGTRIGTPEYERLAEAWLDDFAARGVTAVGFGYVLLRRPADSPASSESTAPARPRLLRTEVLGSPLGAGSSGIGDHLLACLAAHDRIAALDDAALAGLRLTVAPDVTEERHYWPGDEGPTVIRLRQGGGFARTVDADAALAGLVGACDGDLPLGTIASALADLLEVDEGALRAQLLPQVRELVLTGFLLPSD